MGYNSFYGLTFNPFDKQQLKEKDPIRKTNKVEHCHTRRNNGPALDYSRIGG